MRKFGWVVGVWVMLAAPAAGQIPLERFNIQRFSPAPGPGNYLQVDGARLNGHLEPGFGLTVDYAHEPFVLFDASCTDPSETNCDVEDKNTELVSYVAQFNLFGSLVLFDRLQVGLNLPLMLSGGEDFDQVVRGDPISISSPTRFVVGDPTLSVKARFYGEGEGLFFGGLVFGTFPVANQMEDEGFLGDESVRVGGHLIAQFVQSGFHLAANFGGFWRPERTFFSTQASSQLTYRLAVGYEVTPLILLFAELDGASGLSAEVDEHPMEVRLAGRLTQGDFQINLAAGAGVISGVGVPVFRVIGGFAYSPSSADRDGDGIEDDADACPADAEDRDGWEDEDGCPEEDDDGDGMVDDDQCPREAEDVDGFQDEDGCPDPDNDGDGVRDGFDGCPNEPEDMDNDRDEDGCPDNDTDRDGIEDSEDRCPNEPEDADGFGDEDGCPETDFDGDNIEDDADECPDQPESVNGISDEDGCPEEDADNDGIVDELDRCPNRPETLNGSRDDDGCPDGEALIEEREGRIVLLQQIQFSRNRARIRTPSMPIIRAVATILARNPQYRRVRIEGHTDNAVRAEANRRLSQQRADAVMQALIRQGVDAGRLSAVGHGQDRPVADNETAEGRAQNRRVEFHIESAEGTISTTTEGTAIPDQGAAPEAAPAE
ncbi:MAG: OmpA family protein [Myxococcota bacterium]